MKKYYGYFIYDGMEYVIRFRIKGSLEYDWNKHCFIDKDYYVRASSDMIGYAALGTHPINDARFGFAYLLTKSGFIEWRSKGVRRWKPKEPVIIWD